MGMDDSDDSDEDSDAELNPDDVNLRFSGKKVLNGSDFSDDDENPKRKRKNRKQDMGGGAVPGMQNEGVVIDMNNIIEIGCAAPEKEREKRVRQLKIEEIEKKIDQLLLDIQVTQNKEKKEKLKLQHVALKNLI